MSDILLSWLDSEAGIGASQVEQDFANGYLWGQLFNKFNLQPDFDTRFENKRTPDAMVNNYTRLQPTFKRLGITMNTRVANSMMREEPGVAMRLLYSVRQSLSQLNKNLESHKNTGRLGKELGTSIPLTRTLLEATQYNTTKQTYEQGSARFFEETMRGKVPTTNKQLMETMHTRKFSEKQYRMEAAAAAAEQAEELGTQTARTAFRDTLQSKMSKTRADKSKTLERDAAVHASLMRRKEEVEREELRVELALAEASRRRKASSVQSAAQDVTHGIDTFEINMKRLLKGDNDGDEQLTPATTHTPLEHQARLRAMATSTTKLLDDMTGYMSGVMAGRAEDVATKREREARRRRVLVEQQAAAAEAERKAELDALLQTLSRQASEEYRLASRLWQLSQEKEVMCENRKLREQQYAQQRAADWEQTLRRELELHVSMRQQYEARAAAEKDSWQQAVAERAHAKHAKHRQMCEGMAWQVVQFAERVIEYRQRTGQKVPRNEWRRWCTMFVNSDPQLGDPVVKDVAPEQPRNALLEKAAVEDWLACKGEFEFEGTAAVDVNRKLCDIVASLATLARTARDMALPTSVKQLPLKLSVVGPPFSGKTSIAHTLARQLQVRVLEPEAVIQAAIAAAKEWAGKQPTSQINTPRSEKALPESIMNAQGDAVDTSAAPSAPETEAAEPLPSNFQQIQIGQRLQACLEGGLLIADQDLVDLMVYEMQATLAWAPPPEREAVSAKGKKPAAGKGAPPPEPPRPVQGFILDGFPRTKEQAVLLEKALTGLDLDAEQAIIDQASRVAPPPPSTLPQLGRTLTSGLDAVLVLSLTDPEAALKRALGRRLDPQTGRVYHLEFDPPPTNDVGLASRLQEVTDAGNDAAQVQQRLLSHTSVSTPLDDWHKRFSRLRRPVDGSGTLQDVLSSASNAVEGVLRAKAAVRSCVEAASAAQKARTAADKAREYAELARSHAEGAARELLVAKKAEIQAQALLDGTVEPVPTSAKGGKDKHKNKEQELAADPAAVELLKAQSAAKCAEQLKVCRVAASDAADHAERANSSAQTAREAVDRARASLGDAEVSATAEVEAKEAAASAEAAEVFAAEAAQRAQIAKEAAEVAVREALRVSEATSIDPNATVELTPPAGPELPHSQQTHESVAADKASAAVTDAQGASGDATVSIAPAALQMPVPVADVFHQEFQAIESSYLEGVTMGLRNFLDHGDLVLSHYDGVRLRMKELLAAPDNRDALVAAFQKSFNAMDVDARKTPEAKAELILRSEELRDAIWALCDKKLEAAEAQKAAVAADAFVADNTTSLAQYHTILAQVELDRLFASLNFIQSAVAAKHGVLHAVQLDGSEDPPNTTALTAQDLLSGSVPPEFKDKVEEKSKTALPMPAFVTQLAPKSSSLALAFKVALASGITAVNSIIPPPEPEGGKKKPAKKEPAKTSKTAHVVAESPAVPPATLEAIKSEVSVLIQEELRILHERLALLAQHATTCFVGLQDLNALTLEQLGDWIKERYKAECGAAVALEKVAKAAAASGELLPAELRLEDNGTLAVVDQTQQVVPVHPGYPLPKPRERPPPASILTAAQLGDLAKICVDLAPGGYMKIVDVAEILLRSAGTGQLPDAWREANSLALHSALRLLDPTQTGYVDWRQLLVCLIMPAFPLIMQASCADMSDQCEMLMEADEDKDGLLSEEEWNGVELWWQYRAGAPAAAASQQLRERHPHASAVSDSAATAGVVVGDGGVSPDEPAQQEEQQQQPQEQKVEVEEETEEQVAARKEAYDRAGALKTILWDAFSEVVAEGSPAAGTRRLDLRAILLYLCADADHFQGMKKAFSVASHSITSNARVDAGQLVKISYPMGTEVGRGINRVPVDEASITQLVKTVFESRNGKNAEGEPSITAEQLMYGAFGEKLVTHVLGRYQWHDVYVATRLALY